MKRIAMCIIYPTRTFKYFSYYKWVLPSPFPPSHTHTPLSIPPVAKNVAKILHYLLDFTFILPPTWCCPNRTSPTKPNHHANPTKAAPYPTRHQAKASTTNQQPGTSSQQSQNPIHNARIKKKHHLWPKRVHQNMGWQQLLPLQRVLLRRGSWP